MTKELKSQERFIIILSILLIKSFVCVHGMFAINSKIAAPILPRFLVIHS